jgi:hypothetical protein
LIGEGFTTTELDSGSFSVYYGGYQSGWSTQTDSGKIEIIMQDQNHDSLGSSDLGWFYSNHTWVLKEGTVPLISETRYIQYGFHSKRYQTSNNDGYLDDAFLTVTTVPVPAAVWLLGSGLIGLVGIRRKFTK